MLLAKDFATVTADNWGVSTTTGTDIKGAILNVYVRGAGPENQVCPACDGLRFATKDDAFQAAFEHGHLMPYLNRRWGLRFTGEAWFPEIRHNIRETVSRMRKVLV